MENNIILLNEKQCWVKPEIIALQYENTLGDFQGGHDGTEFGAGNS